MANPNIKKFYQHSNKQYYYLPHAVGHGAPTTIPEDAGLMYIDVDTQDIYVSAGKSSVSDWKVVTGGGGSSITLSTNGTVNPDQTALNLQEGTGISLVDNGSGQVTISSTLYTKVQTAPVDVTIDGTFTDVPELFFIPEIGKSYTFKAVLHYNIADPSYGSGWTIDLGTSTFSYTGWYNQYWDSTSLVQYINLNSASPLPPLTSTSKAAESNIAIIEGVLTECSNIGPFVVRVAGSTLGPSIVNGLRVLPGSSLVVYETV